MPPAPPRRRNAAATREAILQSAVGHFARAGYDGVGVREIARDAGVTAMLVNRYFGSKEQLFAEAVDTSFATPVFVAEDPEALIGGIVEALVQRTAPDVDTPEPFLILLRSVSNPRATEIVRDAITRHVGARLARRLPGPQGALRGEVVLSVIAGVLLMRRVLGTAALEAAGADELRMLLSSTLAAALGTK
ncbi:TetR/AcrR family transcriptional regulator [Mycobacterium sp. NPDC003323]